MLEKDLKKEAIVVDIDGTLLMNERRSLIAYEKAVRQMESNIRKDTDKKHYSEYLENFKKKVSYKISEMTYEEMRTRSPDSDNDIKISTYARKQAYFYALETMNDNFRKSFHSVWKKYFFNTDYYEYDIPIKSAAEVLTNLKKNYMIIYNTARSSHTEYSENGKLPYTKEWLAEHGFPESSEIICANGDPNRENSDNMKEKYEAMKNFLKKKKNIRPVIYIGDIDEKFSEFRVNLEYSDEAIARKLAIPFYHIKGSIDERYELWLNLYKRFNMKI